MAFHPLVDLVRRQFAVEDSRRRRGHRREDRAGSDRDRRGPRPGRALPARPAVGRPGRGRRAGHEPGAATRRDLRGPAPPAGPRSRAAAAGAGDRGPALDRQRERAVPGDAGGQRARAAGAARLHLPAGVREPVRRAQLLHPRRPAGAVRRGQRTHGGRRPGHRRPARRAARRWSRARPRAIRSTSRSWSSRWRRAGRCGGRRTRYELARAGGARSPFPARSRTSSPRGSIGWPRPPSARCSSPSVIGREFTRRLVDRLAEIRERTDGLLRELTALELIHERRLFPELAYMFKHALTQDVAYASLLVQRRKRAPPPRRPRHRGALRRPAPRALRDARPSLLARRGLGARARLPAQGRREGDAGVRPAPGAGSLRRGAGGSPPAGRSRARATLMAIHRARADLFFGVGDFGRSHEAAEALVALARRLGDRVLEANALVQLACRLAVGRRTSPRRCSGPRRRSRSPRRTALRARSAAALYVRSYVYSVTGQLEESEAEYTRALEIGRARGDPLGRGAGAAHPRDRSGAGRDDTRRAWSSAGEGTRLGREGRLVVGLLRNLWTQGLALTDTGSYDAALAALSEGQALAEKIGDDAYLPRFLNTVGWLRIECGDLTRGIDLSELSYEVTGRSSRAGHGTGAERRAFIRNNEAEALMVRGELGGRRRSSGGEPSHRPASAALALDDLALHDPVLRGPRPARALAGRSWTSAATRRPEPGGGRAHALAKVRELGVAHQGGRRDPTRRLGRGRGRAATGPEPGRGDRPAAPDLAEPRRARAAGRGEWSSRQRARPLSLRVGHHHWPARPDARSRRCGPASNPPRSRAKSSTLPAPITSDVEERHGFAGALRTTGGYGGHFGAHPTGTSSGS